MKKTAILLIIMFLSGCQNSGTDAITVGSQPVPGEELTIQKPESNWKLLQEIILKVPTEEPAAVVIYQDPKDEQQMYGFLNYKSQYYSLGSVSSYGLDDVTIKEQDVTCDSTPELIIQGSQGASYREIQIMLYDEQNEKWLRVLKTGSPRFADLNGDGKRELLSVSTGTNPPYVWIYEWEEDHFQMADVAEAVGGNAAILKKRDGQWVIEVYDNGDQRLYQYNHGNLISVE